MQKIKKIPQARLEIVRAFLLHTTYPQ